MSLISMKAMLSEAREKKYAVGYFESWNLESLKAVIGAAEQVRSPVIIGFNGGMLTDPKRLLPPENLEYYGAIGGIAAKNASVPVSLILNEIHTHQLVLHCIEYGFNAVMFECDSDDLNTNIRVMKDVVDTAHSAGITVESNIGQLPSADKGELRRRDHHQSLTDPKDAERFVEETGVDVLGVSIGNVEVLMDNKAALDFDLLESIQKAVDIPLTLHGGSGIADEDIEKLIHRGLCKINIGAALNQAFIDGMQNVQTSSKGSISPKFAIGSGLKDDIMAGGELSLIEFVKHKMKVYGCAGKAY